MVVDKKEFYTKDDLKKVIDHAIGQNRLDPDDADFAKQIALFTSYYRQNIQRFAEDYLGLRLKRFQKFLLYMIHNHLYTLLVMTRGIGKSWLIGVYACCLAILYPNSEIVIVSHTLRQSVNIIDKKILLDLCKKSKRLNSEIDKVEKAHNNMILKFKNGSTITPAVSSEASRGIRSTCLIIDESRLVNNDVIQSILQPTSHPRQASYMDLLEYSADNYNIESSRDIYLTSAYFKVHPLYAQYKDYLAKMVDGKEYFACALSVDVAVNNGLLDAKRLEAIKSQPDMSQVKYAMEYETIFYGESEDAYFNLQEITSCQVVNYPFLLADNTDHRKGKEFKTNPKKLPNEIRLISADIALMAGNSNDASAFILFRLIPNDKGRYIRQIVNIETFEGSHAFDQAKRLKQMFYDFEADYIVLDCIGSGVAVYGHLCRLTEDDERGQTYRAFKVFNNDELEGQCTESNALPCIYAVKGTQQFNHDCHTRCQDMIQRELLQFLVDTEVGKTNLSSEYQLDAMIPSKQANMLSPYLQTERLISEMINLKTEVKSGYIKLRETSYVARKDRYMSLTYGNYYATELEQDLNTGSDDDLWGSIWN